MSELTGAGVQTLLDLFRSGEASPAEAVRACLDRIEALDGELNAVTTLCADSALAGAERAAQRWRSGEARPLEGVPYGLKDVIDTAGVRTTRGSAIFADRVPERDAVVVEALRDAGAILVAKLHTFAFALGGPDVAGFGWTRNPRAPDRIAGGSSSGPAAAVAAGMLPFAIGTDTGGSIRLPAAYCGIAGLRPTPGRVPLDGIFPLTWTLDTAGPMAREAADLEPVLAALSSPRPDTAQLRPDAVVVGVPRAWFFDECSPGVLALVEQALAQMQERGARVVEVEIPHAGLADDLGRTIVTVEAGAIHEELLQRVGEQGYPPDFAARLVASRRVLALDYARALRMRTLLADDFAAAFARVDVVVTPTSAVEAPRHAALADPLGPEASAWRQLATRMTFPVTLAGVPAVSVPAPTPPGALPAGVQIAGPPGRDELCLRVAAAYGAG